MARRRQHFGGGVERHRRRRCLDADGQWEVVEMIAARPLPEAVGATARRIGEGGREAAAAPLGIAGERAAVARRRLLEQPVPPSEHPVVELLT